MTDQMEDREQGQPGTETEQKQKKFEKRKILEAAILLAGVVSFWGFLYPELSLTEDEDIQIQSFIVTQIKELKEAFDDQQKCTHWSF